MLPLANAVCLLGVPAIARGVAQSELLRDRAENNPDEKVREFAQKKLAKLEE